VPPRIIVVLMALHSQGCVLSLSHTILGSGNRASSRAAAAARRGHERRPYTSDKCLSSSFLFFSLFFSSSLISLFFSFLFSPQGPVDVR
jgi:hypothetical protein